MRLHKASICEFFFSQNMTGRRHRFCHADCISGSWARNRLLEAIRTYEDIVNGSLYVCSKFNRQATRNSFPAQAEPSVSSLGGASEVVEEDLDNFDGELTQAFRALKQ